MIDYRVSPVDPPGHEFEIRLRVAAPNPAGQVFALPAWIPGSYMIRDFARNLLDVRATCGGEPVPLVKLDKQTWQAGPCAGTLEVRYRVYANDLSVRSAFLDVTRGYFNGPSVFLRAVGHDGACALSIVPPPGGSGADWRVATTLTAGEVDAAGFGRYLAADYATLIDNPVEMACFERLEFTAAGVPHAVVLSGRQRCDGDRLKNDLAAICAEHVGLFGELPQMSQYLFLVLALGEGYYGGLEHRECCSLICDRGDLPAPGMAQPSEGYRRFLGLCSHEYFHLWNVKRILPEVLQRPDLSREVHTAQLWAFEGITSYYDDLALLRSGRIDLPAYLGMLAQTVTRVMRGGGRLRQSVAESSFDAWTKFYRQDENAPNAIVSYYAKGALVAFGLDMTLRQMTGERVSLDDLMRALWRRHGLTGVGVPEGGIERIAADLAGGDLAPFFADFVHGTVELPLERWFEGLGIGYRLRAAGKPDDLGGVIEQVLPAKAERVLGARFAAAGELSQLTHVYRGGPAHAAGLAAGDRLVAIDGIQAKADGLAARVAALPDDRPSLVHALRRDELMTFSLAPAAAPQDTCELWLLDDAVLSAPQRRRREAWQASCAAPVDTLA